MRKFCLFEVRQIDLADALQNANVRICERPRKLGEHSLARFDIKRKQIHDYPRINESTNSDNWECSVYYYNIGNVVATNTSQRGESRRRSDSILCN